MWLTSQIMKNTVKLFTRHDNTNTALELKWRAIHRPIRVPGEKDNDTHTHRERHRGYIRQRYNIKIVMGPNVRNNYLCPVLNDRMILRDIRNSNIWKTFIFNKKKEDNRFLKRIISKRTNNSNKDRSSF